MQTKQQQQLAMEARNSTKRSNQSESAIRSQINETRMCRKQCRLSVVCRQWSVGVVLALHGILRLTREYITIDLRLPTSHFLDGAFNATHDHFR